MPDHHDEFRDSFYYRAIRTRIGAALRAQFDVSQPLPDRITALLSLLGKGDSASAEPMDGKGATGREPAGETRR